MEPWMTFALAGFAGAICREIILGGGVLVLPRIQNGRIRLGFLSTVIVGVVVALIVDHTPQVAFWSAVGGSHLIETVAQRGFDKLNGKGEGHQKEQGGGKQ